MNTQRPAFSTHIVFVVIAVIVRAWRLFPLLLLTGLAGCSKPLPPSFVLVVVDTLRADHLSFYGYERDTTPGISRWVDEAAIFERCISPIPLTDPAISSIMTGIYPTRHGVRDTGYRLEHRFRTLAEILKSYEYNTAAFVSRSGLTSDTGLNQGFDIHDDRTLLPCEMKDVAWNSIEGAEKWQRRAGEVTDVALEWLEKRSDEPFFLWLHYYDPHAYYDPPEPFRSRFPKADTPYQGKPLWSWWGRVTDIGSEISRYDGEILTVDHHLSRIVEKLKQKKLWDSMLFVVTSDHGESLGEHGHMDHGEWLYEEQVHVPLFMRFPPKVKAGLRITDMVSLLDLMPTALDLLGLPLPETEKTEEIVDGRSLVPLMRDYTVTASPVFTESENCPSMETPVKIDMVCGPPGVKGKLRAVHEGKWKLIVTPMYGSEKLELYDLDSDPEENRNVKETYPDILHQLKGTLEAHWSRGSYESKVDNELVDRLRALGYAF
jgi:arylsulfatase A-like enzyme